MNIPILHRLGKLVQALGIRGHKHDKIQWFLLIRLTIHRTLVC